MQCYKNPKNVSYISTYFYYIMIRCAIWYKTPKNGVRMVSVLKADNEIKARKRMFSFKNLINV